MRSAVLFLIFNRPDTTALVFEALRQARPPRLYVAADGPRATRQGEALLCEQSRRIATAVDWPCEVVTLFRSENLGCKRAVSSAITWFFEQEPEGIVLEDDCLPDPSFFPYCDELLSHYRDDPRVMCISGDNFISSHWQPEESYFFSRYAFIWGWASWARAWMHYRVDLSAPGEERVEDVLARTFVSSPSVHAHWRQALAQVLSGKVDTWDYQWLYTLWRQQGLCCLPRVNLISNIGFGASATHTTNPESRLANLAASGLSLPLKHPDRAIADSAADIWTEAELFDISSGGMRRQVTKRVLNRLRAVYKHWTSCVVPRVKGRSS